MTENLVIVRSYGGIGLIRAVLSHLSTGTVVCLPEYAEAIRRGERRAPLFGFPKKDVYAYDPAAANAIMAGRGVDWSKMKLAKTKGAAN